MSKNSPDDFAHALKDKKWDPHINASRLPGSITSRGLGLFFFAMSIIGFFVTAYFPISDALAQKETIDFRFKLVIATPLIFCISTDLLIRGDKALDVIFNGGKLNRTDIVVYAVTLVTTISYFVILKSYLSSLGYSL